MKTPPTPTARHRSTTKHSPLTRNLALLALLVIGIGSAAAAQGAALRGTVTSRQDGATIPGAEVEIISSLDSAVVAQAISGDTGRFLIEGLAAGTYQARVSFPGFQEYVKDDLKIEADQTLEVGFQLELSEISEKVEVTGRSTDQPIETGSAQQSIQAELIDIAPVRGDDFSDLLPLLPGVLRSTDGRLVMKGGRPTQSSLVVNNSTNATDPSTGNPGFSLPVDAIETVDVLPNPYAPEFGRFSSGVTNVLTRQGTNKWKFTINNFLPRFKVRDEAIMGIGGFTPRMGFRGPLIKDRLFLAQNLQYKFVITKVPSLPELERDTRLESFSSFTQLDANLNSSNTLSAVFSLFPSKFDYVNLDTFNPREQTPNLHQRGYNIGLVHRSVLSAGAVLESTISFKRFDADVFGQGFDDFVFGVEVNQGNYFNTQRRRTRTWQWVEQLSLLKDGWGGQHLFKFGVDLLRSSFDGLSETRPLEIHDAQGRVSHRISYSDTTSQRERSTDVAFFVQDRFRPNERVLLEMGFRVDRDSVFDRTNAAPRFGFVLGLDAEGRNILRGGAGLFYDRIPLNVAAFESYERPTVERFNQRGEQIESRTFSLINAPNLRTPYSFTWNLEFNRRLTPRWLVKVNFLRRNGLNELLVDPIEDPLPQYRLESRGRSRYWEVELTSRLIPYEDSHLIFSYVRSRSKTDLNDFDGLFGNFRNPILRPNQFSLGNSDTPNRFIAQGTLKLPGAWLFSPVVEVRNGFPYSLIDEDRNFVGLRNADSRRFPVLTTLDVDIQRWFKIRGRRMRIGFRLFNIFNTFNARDVQNNIDSPRFGTFFNTLDRIFGATFQLEP